VKFGRKKNIPKGKGPRGGSRDLRSQREGESLPEKTSVLGSTPIPRENLGYTDRERPCKEEYDTISLYSQNGA